MCMKSGVPFDANCDQCNTGRCYVCFKTINKKIFATKNGHNYCYICVRNSVLPMVTITKSSSGSSVVTTESLQKYLKCCQPPHFSMQTSNGIMPIGFEQLLKDPSFSDVTFLVGDEKITAHRAILAGKLER